MEKGPTGDSRCARRLRASAGLGQGILRWWLWEAGCCRSRERWPCAKDPCPARRSGRLRRGHPAWLSPVQEGPGLEGGQLGPPGLLFLRKQQAILKCPLVNCERWGLGARADLGAEIPGQGGRRACWPQCPFWRCSGSHKSPPLPSGRGSRTCPASSPLLRALQLGVT